MGSSPASASEKASSMSPATSAPDSAMSAPVPAGAGELRG